MRPLSAVHRVKGGAASAASPYDRWMRILLLIILVLLLVPWWSGPSRLPLLGNKAAVEAVPVTLFPDQPGIRKLGALTFERGYQLTSPDPTFGGFSSLLIDRDAFTLLSDGGNIVRFRLDASGSVSESRFAELPTGPGTGWEKRDRDSESMTRDPATGRTWVGFEHANAIFRYAPGFVRGEASVSPPAMRDWPANGGPEAMTRLRDGRFVVFGEDDPWPGGQGRAAIRFDGDPTKAPRRGFRFSYLPPAGFSPTDVAELPDGRLILLNRRFTVTSGFTAVVTIIARNAIRPGASVRGQEVARFAPPAIHDNFEGIAVTREGGVTRIWIVSDDNQMPFQRTLLLAFRLDAKGATARPRR